MLGLRGVNGFAAGLSTNFFATPPGAVDLSAFVVSLKLLFPALLFTMLLLLLLLLLALLLLLLIFTGGCCC